MIADAILWLPFPAAIVLLVLLKLVPPRLNAAGKYHQSIRFSQICCAVAIIIMAIALYNLWVLFGPKS